MPVQNAEKMTSEEAREIFTSVIEKTDDPDLRARREIVREYFTNPDFRRGLADHIETLISTPR